MLINMEEQVNIQFHDIYYSVKEGRKKGHKDILKGVSGQFASGELIAILGPSGAGKTTLMNVFAGFKYCSTRSRKVSGRILINDRERDIQSFRKMSCYIMQENLLFPHLTVVETIMVAANLKLPDKTSTDEKRRVTNTILSNLGLIDCMETRVSNLSGGEKKRLSIAQELVSNPAVIFLDEPTSGLDSSSCHQCVSMLKSLASCGRTIVCTIHQPSAKLFELFDELLVLADGRCIYQGTPHDLIPFLSSLNFDCPAYHNPADFVIEVASSDHQDNIPRLQAAVANINIVGDGIKENATKTEHEAENIISRIKKSDLRNAASTNPSCVISFISAKTPIQCKQRNSQDYNTKCWTQFTVIFIRTLFTVIREPMITHLQIVSQICTGLLIGTLYYNIGQDADSALNNCACLFFSVLFLTFASLMPTVLTFPLERSIIVRENLNCWYSLKAYYLARSTVDVPFQLIYPVIYTSIMYWMTSQPNNWLRFSTFLSFAMLTMLVGQSLGLLIGAATNVQIAVFLAPSIQIPLLLFSGFFIKFSSMPSYLHWISYVSPIRYTFEGLMLSVYGNHRDSLNCSQSNCHYANPEKILEQMDFSNGSLYIPFIALFCILIILRTLGYIVLCWKISSEQ